ncbi:MAG: PilZ domain-containing protein [Candidatus Omnitrophica bacterium]|nr:PilZ domain-containing protein [Candidatus Omnitrophota bacterium]
MQERRIFERLQVELPVKFSYLGGAKAGMGKIVNISAGGGGMIVTGEKLLPATRLDMQMEIDENKEPLYAKGEVVWTMVSGPQVYKVGIKFDKIDLMGISRILRKRNE